MTAPKPYRGGCAPGMPRVGACLAPCQHRELVEEYRAARAAWEDQRESGREAPTSVPGVAHSSAAMHQLEDADYRTAYPAPTFRDWLEQTAGQRREPA